MVAYIDFEASCLSMHDANPPANKQNQTFKESIFFPNQNVAKNTASAKNSAPLCRVTSLLLCYISASSYANKCTLAHTYIQKRIYLNVLLLLYSVLDQLTSC